MARYDDHNYSGYVSNYVPRNLPFDLLAATVKGKGAALDKAQSDLESQDFKFNYIQTNDQDLQQWDQRDIASRKYNEYNSKTTQAIDDLLATGDTQIATQRLAKLRRDFSSDKQIAQLNSDYAQFNDYSKMRADMKKDPDKYQYYNDIYAQSRPNVDSTTGMPSNFSFTGLDAAFNQNKEMKDFLGDFKVSGSEEGGYAVTDLGIEHRTGGREGITRDRIEGWVDNNIDRYLVSAAGKDLARQFAYNNKNNQAFLQLSQEDKVNAFRQYTKDQLVQVGDPQVHMKTKSDVTLSPINDWVVDSKESKNSDSVLVNTQSGIYDAPTYEQFSEQLVTTNNQVAADKNKILATKQQLIEILKSRNISTTMENVEAIAAKAQIQYPEIQANYDILMSSKESLQANEASLIQYARQQDAMLESYIGKYVDDETSGFDFFARTRVLQAQKDALEKQYGKGTPGYNKGLLKLLKTDPNMKGKLDDLREQSFEHLKKLQLQGYGALSGKERDYVAPFSYSKVINKNKKSIVGGFIDAVEGSLSASSSDTWSGFESRYGSTKEGKLMIDRIVKQSGFGSNNITKVELVGAVPSIGDIDNESTLNISYKLTSKGGSTKIVEIPNARANDVIKNYNSVVIQKLENADYSNSDPNQMEIAATLVGRARIGTSLESSTTDISNLAKSGGVVVLRDPSSNKNYAVYGSTQAVNGTAKSAYRVFEIGANASVPEEIPNNNSKFKELTYPEQGKSIQSKSDISLLVGLSVLNDKQKLRSKIKKQ